MSRASASSNLLEGRRGDALVSVLERAGVELRHAGRELRALCPFHPEKTPSFFANPESGAYFCHGCGAKGDAITFVEETRGLPYPKALEAVLAELGEAAPVAIPRPARQPEPERNAGAPWARLAEKDPEAEAYLAGRGLLHRDPNVLRFNIGESGDSWLDARAREGYRVAFAVRRPSGLVQTISLRYVRAGDAPDRKKTLVLPGCSTKGAAIVSPSIRQLAEGDPEFAGDRVLVLEGGTDWLGASALFAQSTVDYGAPATWALAGVGARQAAGIVAAFEQIVRWRTVIVGLDADPAGRAAAAEVEIGARKAGARDVVRLEPIRGAKDWAALAQMEYA